MKPSVPKEVRQQNQVERGLVADRIAQDEFIMGWFDNHRDSLVKKMLSAEIADDQTRRDAALEIKTLDSLKRHIESEATLGRKASEDLRKAK